MSSAITRRPARVSVVTQPGATQLTSLVEAKPCTSTIGSPSPFVEIGDLDSDHVLKLRHGRVLKFAGDRHNRKTDNALCISHARPAMVRDLQRRRAAFRGCPMADHVVPHFHNDPGVPVIEIGAREFMCVGATPPFDHPHVFLDMGDDNEIICPYCSTLYRHDPALDAARGAAGGMRAAPIAA